jgi:hypothetical protein
MLRATEKKEGVNWLVVRQKCEDGGYRPPVCTGTAVGGGVRAPSSSEFGHAGVASFLFSCTYVRWTASRCCSIDLVNRKSYIIFAHGYKYNPMYSYFSITHFLISEMCEDFWCRLKAKDFLYCLKSISFSTVLYCSKQNE